MTAKDSDGGDDISLEEDYNEDSMLRRRSEKKEKKLARSKHLSGGGKVLKQELAKQAKKSKKGKKVSRKLSSLEEGEVGASGSLQHGVTIRSRAEEIHRTSTNAWRRGQDMGMTVNCEGDDVQGLISDLVGRNWDTYEQQQNE